MEITGRIIFAVLCGILFVVYLRFLFFPSKKAGRKDLLIWNLSYEVSDIFSNPLILWNHRDIKKALMVHKKARRIIRATKIDSEDIEGFSKLENILQEEGVLRTVEEINSGIQNWNVTLRTRINWKDIEKTVRVRGVYSLTRKDPAIEDAVNAAIDDFIAEITASGKKIEKRITADVFSTDKLTGFGMERYV